MNFVFLCDHHSKLTQFIFHGIRNKEYLRKKISGSSTRLHKISTLKENNKILLIYRNHSMLKKDCSKDTVNVQLQNSPQCHQLPLLQLHIHYVPVLTLYWNCAPNKSLFCCWLICSQKKKKYLHSFANLIYETIKKTNSKCLNIKSNIAYKIFP